MKYINVGDVCVVTGKIISGFITLHPGAVVKILGLAGKNRFSVGINKEDEEVALNERAPRQLNGILVVPRNILMGQQEWEREQKRQNFVPPKKENFPVLRQSVRCWRQQIPCF